MGFVSWLRDKVETAVEWVKDRIEDVVDWVSDNYQEKNMMRMM